MGCDIHSFVEVKNQNGEWSKVKKKVFKDGDILTSSPFSWRSYSVFGFLADVRNYSYSPCLTGKRRGVPNDLNECINEYNHSYNWFTLKELIDYDYDQNFEDRRTESEISPKVIDYRSDSGIGNGEVKKIREFLSNGFFDDVEALKQFGKPEDVRVIVSFDS